MSLAFVFTTAKYSKKAKKVAKDLGVELNRLELNTSYPIIKCCISENGDKSSSLPFDSHYDEINIDIEKGEFYAHNVQEAVNKGFQRLQNFKKAA